MPSTRTTKRDISDTASSKPGDQECATCESHPGRRPATKAARELWVECDHCGAWNHWECVKASPDDLVESIDKWYCTTCVMASEATDDPLEISYKDSPRKTARKTAKLNYASIEHGLENDPERWMRIAESKPIAPETFKRLKGKDLNLEWVMSDSTAFTEPILIESPDGLDMKMPRATMTVHDVSNIVGPETKVEVMDVASQNGLDNWTLGRWAQYFHDPQRSKIRNVISLEVSDTKLSPKVIPPRLVRQLDWIEKIWPKELKAQGVYPKVQKYCLMSVAKCWTDWHVDFAASSVYYHILSGGKTFFFIRPTPDNLRKYEVWSGSSSKQEQEWLGDAVDAVYRVDLKPGNTMIIPSGWIHSVYTPSDALVFGGNFLHSLNIGTQLRLFEIEKKTKVPMKYRFPYFVTFCWYVGKYYTARLEAALAGMAPMQLPSDVPNIKAEPKIDTGGLTDFTSSTSEKMPEPIDPKPRLEDPELTPRVLAGLKKLTIFLLEQGERFLPDSKATADAKRWASDNLPETISAPYEFATTFRALVLRALGEKEDQPLRRTPSSPVATMAKKPKTLSASPAPAAATLAPGAPKFRNFASEPKVKAKSDNTGDVAERSERRQPVHKVARMKRARPDSDGFEDGRGELEDVEVRTKKTENQVTKVVRCQDGRVIREVRTVTTTVERTVWEASPSKVTSTSTSSLPGSGAMNGANDGSPSNGVTGHLIDNNAASTPATVRPISQFMPKARVQSALPPAPGSKQTAAATGSRLPASQPYLQYNRSGPVMPSYALPQSAQPVSVAYAPPGVPNPMAYHSAVAYAPKVASYGIPAQNGAIASAAYYTALMNQAQAMNGAPAYFSGAGYAYAPPRPPATTTAAETLGESAPT